MQESPADYFAKMQARVSRSSIEAAVGVVASMLASIGVPAADARNPYAEEGNIDGRKVIFAAWSGTPVGDIVLIGGPAWESVLVQSHDLQTTMESRFGVQAKSFGRSDKSSAKLGRAAERGSRFPVEIQRAVAEVKEAVVEAVQAAEVADKAEKKVRKARATGKKVAAADVKEAVQAAAVAEVKAEEAVAAAEVVIEAVQAQPSSPSKDEAMAQMAGFAEHMKKMLGL